MKNALTILFIHLSLLTFGQINYTTVPIDLQLVARDKVTNLGNVKIEGNVDQLSNYGFIKVEVYRNEVLLNTEDNELTYIDSKAPFLFNLSIKAELANYSFKIYGYKSAEAIYELNKTVSNVVAGDVYIIQGQSNAVAGIKSGSANGSKSNYIRVYSSGTASSLILISNNAWYVADGDVGSGTDGHIGQWGLKLARMLIDNLQIPIAVFNGAHSGQPISFFQAASDYKTSLSSNYGRLYYRLNQTGLKNNVRAVLWSQGESNAQSSYTSILSYKNYFKALENSWVTDYPNIEKIYIFQTKDCNCSTTADGKMNVKEAQRQLASENNEIEIMPTTSLYLHTDNCHFPFVNGYESFATRIHKLVLHDIYGISYTEEIKAPMIKSAEFIAPNTLVLETDAISLKFSSTDQTTMLTRLKQDFELRNAQGALITDVVLSGNKIYFTLSSDPGPIGNVSFVGYNSNIGFTITNSSNIELISFRNFPIKNLTYNGGNNSSNPVIENTFICNAVGSSASIAVNSSTTNTIYTWLVKTPDGEWTAISSLNASTVYSTYNTAILNIKKSSTLPVTGTLYRVIVNDGVYGDLTSNEATLIVDTTPVSKLITGASPVCSGESKTLNYGIGSVGTIQWQYSTTSSTSNFIDLYEENGLTYTASDLQQTTWFRVANESGACPSVYSAAVQVIVNPKPVAGTITGGDTNVCKTSNLTVLTLNNSVGTIKWQKLTTLTGTPSYITSATASTYTASGLTTTTYYRAVLSSGVCDLVYSPIVQIGVNVVPVFNPISPICNGSPMSPLPTISINGVRGTWSPAVNNTATMLYTFVPNGVCVNTTTMTITVNTTAAPVGDEIQGFNMNISKTISDLVVVGSNIRWYTSIENALANTTPLELSTILVMGNTYYAMQTINGCSSTTPLAVKTYVNVNLGITDFDFNGLQFYPNPISDYFTIIYTERITTVELFNTIGQSLHIAHPNALKTTLNVNFLPSGVYYIEIKANNKKGLLKVIKK
jgi:hypothetical protein